VTPVATVAWATWLLAAGDRFRQDVLVGPAPPPFNSASEVFRERELGSGISLYVNFDGVDLGSCNPSNSKKNCHWYNNDPIAPYSGDTQARVAIVQAMRRHTDAYGIRITTLRPENGDYAMVVYGGTEKEFGALGSAPAGDCLDTLPNEIAFAHLDGDLAPWVVAGSTTALHEAAHTWGLDHIDLATEIMYPEGDNSPTSFDDRCHRIVADTNLADGEPSCPDLDTEICGAAGQQNSHAVLTRLFGPPYVDTVAPAIELVSPEDGEYFQAPADFDVVLEIRDDLHPQAYTMWTWYGDGPRPADSTTTVAPGFRVDALPVGTWSFHVAVADEAGLETQLDFEIEVGVDPPAPPQDGGCRVSGPPSRAGADLGFLPLLLARRRRRR
jgi:hypothetical protein